MVELTENDLKNYLCYMELHDVDDDEMANPLALAFLTKRGAIDIVDNDSGEISRITPKESKSLSNGDFYLYGLINGIEKELGMFTLKQILEVGAELDATFTPIGVFDIYDDFDLRY